ncbi:MAG: hypothetical protein ACKVW3_13010 [Phycisphaerales bacterium]
MRPDIAAPAGLMALTVLICGCSTVSVADLEARTPDRVYFTAEHPSIVLSKMALEGERAVGRPELFDPEAGRLALAHTNWLYRTRYTLLVVRVLPEEGGSTVRMWQDGLQPITGSTWADWLWAQYAKQAEASSIEHRLLAKGTPPK